MGIYEKIRKKISKIPKFVWVLLAILFVGIFFRTYHFHDWLQFETDQVRNIITIEQVTDNGESWPLLGPTMKASNETEDTLFHIGPIYYHFQIISALIFGLSADAMAYPDLFFGILVIPLFYCFLKRYFSINISLYLVGVYALSFFAIKYSRFSWNPNLIPFFVILFLLATHEFLLKKEKTSWFWASILGVAFGIGIQLHAIMLLIFCLSFGALTVYLLIRNSSAWKKLLIVILVAMIINIPQIVSEFQTGFTNSRTLIHSSVKNTQSAEKSLFSIVADTVSCHIEANAHLLSSFGQENCNYTYAKIFENNRTGKALRGITSWPVILIIFLFSVFGYSLLVYRFRTEQDEGKKYFLGLILVFSVLFFIVTLPVIGSDFKEFRYFNPIFFVSFIFFGLIIDFLLQKQRIVYIFLAIALSLLIIGTNIISLYTMTKQLYEQRGNDGHSVFFGELENIVRFMKDTSGTSKEIFIMSDKVYAGNIFIPVAYVSKEYGYNIIKVPNPDTVPKGSPLFFIAKNREDKFDTEIYGVPVKNTQNFGGMRLYQLEY